MVKWILLLGLVVLSCSAPNYAYEYLGFYVNSDYWIGDTQMPATGRITPDCVKNFGKGSIVVSIDNINEWNWLTDRLAAVRPCTDCTTNFWASRKWDITPQADSQVTISITGTISNAKVFKRTNPFKYICETPPSPYPPSTKNATTTTTLSNQELLAIPTTVPQCLNNNDVIFLLDSSGSIGAEYYKKAKNFVYEFARSFQNQQTSRFGLTIFSTTIKRIVPLQNTLSAADLNSAILNADYMTGGTLTNLAINSAISEFAGSTRPVTKNLITITDGQSNEPSATLASIFNAKYQGIRMFAIGVGSNTSDAELIALAGGEAERMATVSSFDGLTALINPLRQIVCEAPPSTQTTTITAARSPNTVSTQELPAIPTPAPQCLNYNDVIFLLDSSGSIGAEYYKKAKFFAYEFARTFHNPQTSRFGLTIFSTTVRRIVPLQNTLSAADWNFAILNADFMAEQTFTNLAIDSAIAEFAGSPGPFTKNLVIITDGASNDHSATLTSINNANLKGIRTFAIGVGSNTSYAELIALAGGQVERLATVSSFDGLPALLNPLRQLVCGTDQERRLQGGKWCWCQCT